MSGLSRGTKADQFTYVPAGTVLPFAGATAPDGWALCDGSVVSRSQYAELYLAIGDAWGNGDGSTTFHLPDLRGRFLRGVDNGAGRDPDVGTRTTGTGGNIGDAVGSVQGDATRKNGLTASQAGHRHIEGQTSSVSDSRWFRYGLSSASTNAYTTGSTGSGRFPYTETVTPSITVGNGDNETRSINVNMNYIIKL